MRKRGYGINQRTLCKSLFWIKDKEKKVLEEVTSRHWRNLKSYNNNGKKILIHHNSFPKNS